MVDHAPKMADQKQLAGAGTEKGLKMIDRLLGLGVANRKHAMEKIKYIYIDPETRNAVATDGHVLFVARAGESDESGYYEPKTLQKIDMDEDYPDYLKILQGFVAREELKVGACPLWNLKGGIKDRAKQIVKIGENLFDYELIKRVYKFMDGSIVKIEAQGWGEPIKFTGADKIAIVMPLRVRECDSDYNSAGEVCPADVKAPKFKQVYVAMNGGQVVGVFNDYAKASKNGDAVIETVLL